MDNSITSRPSRIPWPPILMALAIGGGILIDRLWPIAWPGLDDTPARVIGLGVGALGVALAIWAIVTLTRARTTVRPDAAASVLVTTGPYARLRNPIYVADVMVLIGIAEMTKIMWIALLAIPFVILVTRLAILPEEAHLEARFGDAWRTYKDRSKRWM